MVNSKASLPICLPPSSVEFLTMCLLHDISGTELKLFLNSWNTIVVIHDCFFENGTPSALGGPNFMALINFETSN